MNVNVTDHVPLTHVVLLVLVVLEGECQMSFFNRMEDLQCLSVYLYDGNECGNPTLYALAR